MFVQPSQIELHLALVFRFEGAQFQVDGDQALELAIEEKEVNIEVIGIYLNPFLTGDEAESDAQLQEKEFQLPEDGVFQVFLQIAVFLGSDPKRTKRVKRRVDLLQTCRQIKPE